jgi:hypothetical protein
LRCLFRLTFNSYESYGEMPRPSFTLNVRFNNGLRNSEASVFQVGASLRDMSTPQPDSQITLIESPNE